MALTRQQEVSPCGKCNVHSIVHSYIMRLGNDMHVFKASISIKRLQYNGNVCLLPDQWIVISVHFLTIKKQWFLALLKSREKPMGEKSPYPKHSSFGGEKMPETIMLCIEHLATAVMTKKKNAV